MVSNNKSVSERMEHAMVVSKRRAVLSDAVRYALEIEGVPNYDYYQGLIGMCVDAVRREVPFDA